MFVETNRNDFERISVLLKTRIDAVSDKPFYM